MDSEETVTRLQSKTTIQQTQFQPHDYKHSINEDDQSIIDR